jgi:hypothetical protein
VVGTATTVIAVLVSVTNTVGVAELMGQSFLAGLHLVIVCTVVVVYVWVSGM